MVVGDRVGGTMATGCLSRTGFRTLVPPASLPPLSRVAVGTGGTQLGEAQPGSE